MAEAPPPRRQATDDRGSSGGLEAGHLVSLDRILYFEQSGPSLEGDSHEGLEWRDGRAPAGGPSSDMGGWPNGWPDTPGPPLRPARSSLGAAFSVMPTAELLSGNHPSAQEQGCPKRDGV